jgi:oligopeptide/dipeptide ABC transporter ATP-binding protein
MPVEPAVAPSPVVSPAEPFAVGAPSARAPVVVDVRDLTTYFYTYDGVVRALEGVSFKLRRGELLGLVGETGCGKSVTAFSMTRLVAEPPGRIVGGKVLFRGANLLWGLEGEASFKPVRKSERVKVRRHFRRIKAAQSRISSVRGRGIAMIFQEPGQAMNPVFPIYDQLGEAILLHRGIEVVDGLLGATPDAPEVQMTIERLASIGANADPKVLRAAAMEVGKAVNVASFGVEAYYTAKEPFPEYREHLIADLNRRLRRLRLSRLQRSYLLRERRFAELDQELRAVHLEEMRQGKFLPAPKRRIRSARLRAQSRGFYYRIWGIKRRASHPLREETFWRVVSVLEGVQIANPAQVARGYPHELSGGMVQRVMIAMALSSDPDVLLADEPTTALDVTIQAQILELMRDLRHRVGTAILLITHDLAVVAEVADRVAVMYAGQIIEMAPVTELFTAPLHPYSQGLLSSIPRFDQPDRKLESIYGTVPNLIRPPTGCRFHPRCPHAMPMCQESRPPLTVEGPGHHVACFLYKGPPAVE